LGKSGFRAIAFPSIHPLHLVRLRAASLSAPLLLRRRSRSA